jgi:glycosyltransferase involved in cell wall biosynthesis
MKKRLLICTQLFYPELISTGQTLTELAESLEKNVDIEVWCAQPSLQKGSASVPRLLHHQGIVIKRLWGTYFFKGNFLGKLINHLSFTGSCFFKLVFDSQKSPVMVLTNPPMLGPLLAIACAIRKRPLIYVVFDVYPETAIAFGFLKKKSWITALWTFGNRICYKQAKDIVVIGRCMQDVIRKSLPKNCQHKLKYIPMWGDDTAIQAYSKPFSYKQKWGLEGKFVLLYSGNMGRFHDVETILMGAEHVKDSHPDIVFVFAGEGHKKALVEHWIKEKKLSNCRIFNHVPREDLPDMLGSADVGLVSLLPEQTGFSVPSKSFGLLAAGLPLIAIMSSTCEIARILNEKEAGHVINPGDVMSFANTVIALYNNPDMRLKLGQNGKQAITTAYSIQQTASAYAALC